MVNGPNGFIEKIGLDVTVMFLAGGAVAFPTALALAIARPDWDDDLTFLFPLKRTIASQAAGSSLRKDSWASVQMIETDEGR